MSKIIEDCRGGETREEIVKEFVIKLVLYARVIPGQTIRSCADFQNNLEDEYYCFSYALKGNENEPLGTFYCGGGAGPHFLELLNIPKPSIFNPLIDDYEPRGQGQRDKQNNSNRKEWNPLAKQLSDAAKLMLVFWSGGKNSGGGVLADIAHNAEQYYYNAPRSWRVKSLNTIIGRDKRKITLTEMLDQVRLENNGRIREYDFSLLIDCMQLNYPNEQINF